jgi:precorrin-2 dehydrogenase/sirohydrochlorin ferrochelatase
MYPVTLNINGRLCVVVGGGRVAERKILALLKAGAQVRTVSPQLTEPLRKLAGAGRIDWQARCFQDGDLVGAMLVFAATDSRQVNELVAQAAKAGGQLVNVADAPEQCGFQVPAVLRQGDLTIAVSTNGKSPALSARIRRRLEADYGPEYAVLLDLLGRMRAQELAGDRDEAARKDMFAKILHEDILDWMRNSQWERLRSHLRAVLGPDADFQPEQNRCQAQHDNR